MTPIPGRKNDVIIARVAADDIRALPVATHGCHGDNTARTCRCAPRRACRWSSVISRHGLSIVVVHDELGVGWSSVAVSASRVPGPIDRQRPYRLVLQHQLLGLLLHHDNIRPIAQVATRHSPDHLSRNKRNTAYRYIVSRE